MSANIYRLETGYRPEDPGREDVAILTDVLRELREDAMRVDIQLRQALLTVQVCTQFITRISETDLPEQIDRAAGVRWPKDLHGDVETVNLKP